MTSDPKAGPGLEPEVLAAYIDNRLSPDERASVEARLATDPDSREVLVEVMKAQDALGDGFMAEAAVASKAVPAPRSRRVAAGGLLAAAAALVLLVRFSPDLMLRVRGGDRAHEHMAALVDAVGDQRYLEGRLTGGFRYGPLRSVTRGAPGSRSTNLALIAAARDIEAQNANGRQADELHALGIAQLLLENLDSAITALDSAMKSTGARPEWRSDLAAAFLAQYQATSDPSALDRAALESSTALALNPNAREALFNLALAQELQGLREDAIATWRRFVEIESDAAWKQEGQRHIGQLGSPR